MNAENLPVNNYNSQIQNKLRWRLTTITMTKLTQYNYDEYLTKLMMILKSKKKRNVKWKMREREMTWFFFCFECEQHSAQRQLLHTSSCCCCAVAASNQGVCQREISRMRKSASGRSVGLQMKAHRATIRGKGFLNCGGSSTHWTILDYYLEISLKNGLF